MIHNATITNINARPAGDLAGDVTWGDGIATSIRCFASDPSRAHKISLSERGVMASMVIYPDKPLPDGLTIAEEDRITVAVDNSGPGRVYEVIISHDRQKDGGLSHYEILLKAAQ